ncbi:MAG: ParB/Srx family N-terminal domain-containing protein [Ilumatobacteraceae bacterium]
MPKKLEFWKLDKLKPYERNSREHSDSQIQRLADSISEFGFLNPIIVDKDAGIIAGHGRLMAARKVGLEKVPVLMADHLTEAQKRAYVIADNRLAELSTWNNEILKSELSELTELGFNTELTGFAFTPIDMPDLDPSDSGESEKSFNISYTIIFDDLEQQKQWFDWLSSLKRQYPNAVTIAEKICAFIQDSRAEDV